MPHTLDLPVLTIDVSCVRCGYNLRTQPLDACCPEYAHPVAVSVRSFEIGEAEFGWLRVQGVDWLRAMRSGFRYAIASWLASAVAAAIIGPRLSMPNSDDRRIAGACWLAPFVAAHVLGAVAAWRWSTTIAAASATQQIRRRLARALILIALASLALLYLNTLLSRFYLPYRFRFHGDHASAIWQLGPMLGSLALFATPVAIGIAFRRLVHITWIGRHRVASFVLAIHGGLAVLGTAFVSVANLDRPFPSGDLMMACPSMIGIVPIVARACVEAANTLGRRLPFFDVHDWLFAGALAYAVFASLFCLIVCMRQARLMTRAIRLETMTPIARR